MGHGGYISNNNDDSEELRSQDSDSDEDGDEICGKKRRKKKVKLGKAWVPERDLKDPHFEVGQHFANCQQFRAAVKKYAVKNEFDRHFNKNTNK
ncbi:hypothetical protein M0R45_026345 [Rubus argutus]|uniref:Transposase MuDR plant domain-containing protein n=1 Tax=Rubus argutus TaxID=59490 RepID=A0AAW1WYL0_RUBAR